jgi:prolyl-tRNA synthetase
MYSLFAKWITSWRDLPLRINQWCNVVRWELRSFSFFTNYRISWHEAHTAHRTKEESDQQVLEALQMYKRFFEEILAIPVVIGKKTERKKFAGTLYSTSYKALLIDGKGL